MSGFGFPFSYVGIICQISCFIKPDKLVSGKSDRNGNNSKLVVYIFYHDEISIMCLFPFTSQNFSRSVTFKIPINTKKIKSYNCTKIRQRGVN